MQKIKAFNLLLFFHLFIASSILQAATLSANEVEQIIDEVEALWLGPNGFMRLGPRGGPFEFDNENPILFTSEYLFLLHRLGGLQGKFKERMFHYIEEKVALLRIVPGLFNRRPESFERHFSRDEQIGLIVLDYLFDYQLGYCRELYHYGIKNDWLFDNQGYGGRVVYNNQNEMMTALERYLTAKRQPGLTALVSLCASEVNPYPMRPWELRVINMALKITSKRPAHLTSGKILAFLSLEVIKDKSPQIRALRAAFYKKLKLIYNSDYFMYEIFKIYFTHEQHPIRRLSRHLKFNEDFDKPL